MFILFIVKYIRKKHIQHDRNKLVSIQQRLIGQGKNLNHLFMFIDLMYGRQQVGLS